MTIAERRLLDLRRQRESNARELPSAGIRIRRSEMDLSMHCSRLIGVIIGYRRAVVPAVIGLLVLIALIAPQHLTEVASSGPPWT